MVFSSLTFILLFLPGVMVGSKLFTMIGGTKAANLFLLAASLFFYAWGEPHYILLMLVSILCNWGFGLLEAWTCGNRTSEIKAADAAGLADNNGQGTREESKRAADLVLAIAVAVNIGLLIYFKYANLLVQTFAGAAIRENWESVHLPIGISFFTFQALSYVIDVRRGVCKAQKDPLKLALYISFFPQLIAGPIVKYRDVAEQIDARTVGKNDLLEGARRFAYGLGKKVLLANAVGALADRIFGLPAEHVSFTMAWVGACAYTFQIYYDFSGYSDMAIGLGRMLGFRFRENFLYPYTSGSIREFWRKWHVSLSSWFRDYVYIPLGGSRCGPVRTYRNLFIVFLLTGIWHGANWTFLAWGLYHGLFIILERAWLGKYLEKQHVLKYIYTGVVVIIGWVIFRCESIGEAGSFILRMLMPWKYTYSPYSVWEWIDHRLMFRILCCILGMGVLQNLLSKYSAKAGKGQFRAEAFYLTVVFLLSLIGIVSGLYNPFLYFRF